METNYIIVTINPFTSHKPQDAPVDKSGIFNPIIVTVIVIVIVIVIVRAVFN